MSSSTDHEKVALLFARARVLSPEERRDLFDRECGDDGDVRREVEELLAHDAAPHPILAETPDQESASVIPDRIGRYEVLGRLARGGQGIVYLARDPRLGRRVAIKLLAPLAAHIDELRTRLIREARAAATLDHPSICGVLDFDDEDGLPYIVMPYVEGPTLGEVLSDLRRRGPPGPKDVARFVPIIEDAARALHEAHEAGLVHRDVKPANIILAAGDRVVLLDFGVAHLDADSELTEAGTVLGTPAYLPPEALDPTTNANDPRFDVYSLGITLYECLARRPAFAAPTPEALYRAILTTEPPPAARLNPAVSDDLGVVLACSYEKDRRRRFRSALAFAEDLRAVREGRPVRARPVGVWGRLRRWASRNRRLAVALLVAHLSLVSGLAASIHFARIASRERERAEASEAAYEKLAETWWRLEQLRAQACRDLWPARADRTTEIERWLQEAREARFWQRECEGLIGPVLSSSPKSPAGAWLRESWTRLDRALEDFLHGDGREGSIPEVAWRLRVSRIQVRAEGLSLADLWRQARREIAASRRYSDLRLVEQPGLVPLGLGPTGIARFALLGSGPLPMRLPDGALVRTGASAIVLALVPAVTLLEAPGPADVEAFFIAEGTVGSTQWVRLHELAAAPPDGDLPRPRSLGLDIPSPLQWEAARREGVELPDRDMRERHLACPVRGILSRATGE